MQSTLTETSAKNKRTRILALAAIAVFLLGRKPLEEAAKVTGNRLKSFKITETDNLVLNDLKITDEVIIRVVGAAEGNLDNKGRKNKSYYGHTDPGDRRHNLGAFSFSPSREGQSITDPEKATDWYLNKRIKPRMKSLITQAERAGLELNSLAFLNAVDLAVQSPEAALGWSNGGNKGFLLNLKDLSEGMKKGITNDAILKARVESFRNQKIRGEKYQAWTGKQGLIRDQGRRMGEIEDTVKVLIKEQKNESN
ncbi:hypothetical protein K9N68_37400 (plasmid) [Kovacikia minuta CCNUW1]|uniref:hypothetical protein n=1 Tax=Kovacikia minuta TaxID=2931930 RepID=UPI001CCBB552|nr:hypothetical protein [Kovacikia minuta]UBF29890.1 hypothetical protein K9N68_37400 [Kovacikia minuta CCNUW1]